MEKTCESSIVQQKKAAEENTKAITNGNRKLGNTFYKGPKTSDVYYLIHFISSRKFWFFNQSYQFELNKRS